MLQVINRVSLILILCSLSNFLCAQSAPAESAKEEAGLQEASLRIEPLMLKTAKGSALPNLTNSADGSALLTWV